MSPPTPEEGPAAGSASADDDATRYQIGEVAERTGVTQRTLRFYEERGLLTPSERMEGGFRLYSERDIARIEYIRQLQNLLGLSLAEIKDMVEAESMLQKIRATYRPDTEPSEREARIGQVRSALDLQREIVERKVEQLTKMRAAILERIAGFERRVRELEREASAGRSPGDAEQGEETPAEAPAH